MSVVNHDLLAPSESSHIGQVADACGDEGGLFVEHVYATASLRIIGNNALKDCDESLTWGFGFGYADDAFGRHLNKEVSERKCCEHV